MIKSKAPVVFAAVFFVNIFLSSASFAVEEFKSGCRYPDYAYEFTGKDTCEKFNRKLFVFNLKLNKYVIRPVNIVWASVMPQYGMDRLKNAYNNANFPVRVVSCLLQKDFKSSRQEAARFLINSTLGIGGLYDPAKDKLKIEPHQEDMAQALAHYKKIKSGPYLVLPVVSGSIRDLVGKLLDCPLRPFSYVPFATAAFFVNNSTAAQPLIKRIEGTYADPYEIARQLEGVDRYIKNFNLDRSDVFKEKTAFQNTIPVKNDSDGLESSANLADVTTGVEPVEEKPCLDSGIKPIKLDIQADVSLNEYNPQGPLIDSMRTAMFDNQKLEKSIWSEMSIWNRCFNKRIKISSVNIDSKRPNYKYRYILQKNTTAPVAIIYPSIGEGIMSDKSAAMAKILYDGGYSVVIQGSSFHWEFVKSMPCGYKPGMPSRDAKYLRNVSAKILANLEMKKGCKFDKKILVGTSFGAMTTLFVAAQEENENTLGISNYISINPPIELFFALRQLDKYSLDWKNDPTDIKMRVAITAEKVIKVSQNIADKNNQKKPRIATDKLAKIDNQDSVKNVSEPKSNMLPFTDDEAKLIIGFIMKQKLSDVVFAIENCSRCKKPMLGESNLYEAINNMSFNDYVKKYLPESFVSDIDSPVETLSAETSLYSIEDFLRNSNKYKIYHSLDDYFVSPHQLAWLKKNSRERTVLYNNGSHLGFMYRKEFIDEFKKDIMLQDKTAKEAITADKS